MATILLALCCSFGHELDPHRVLFEAIRQVESGGNDRATGDGGTSRGPYQIGRAYWRDSGVPWEYDTHVWSRRHCERVMVLYWQRYRAETDEARARLHNGGPGGMRKAVTLRYWRRVQEAMR